MCDCDRDSGLMCVKCRDKIIDDWYQSKNHPGLICLECSERENMETKNLEITVKLNGKEVPLNTISTETFEAIKALEKPKEIPVARVGNYKNNPGDRRLFLRLTDSIRQNVARVTVDVITINLKDGYVSNMWRNDKEKDSLNIYENVKPL